MTRITIDTAAAAQLSGFDGAVELCDPAGRTVGLFQPNAVRSTSENTPNLSQQQLEQFAVEPGGRSLQEIVSDLEARP